MEGESSRVRERYSLNDNKVLGNEDGLYDVAPSCMSCMSAHPPHATKEKTSPPKKDDVRYRMDKRW
jgi:hypothetical protein